MQAVLITGASRGIGRVCVRALEQKGFFVFAGVRSQADAEELQQNAGPELRPVILDITKESTIQAAYEQVADTVGDAGLYGLVNNAGILISAPVECVTLATLREQFEVNVVGQVAVTQAFLPLIRAGGGRIVMLSSIAGFLTLPYTGVYCASKFALEALSGALRMELARWRIPVSLIQPPAIKTELWDTALERAPADVTEDQCNALHKPFIAIQRQRILREMRTGIPPQRVARAVIHALTAKRPRVRYGLGLDAMLARIGFFLPARVLDRYLMWRFGLYRQ
ncbi:MAG: SDR family oxidoreductase [Pseudomonadota bacterium]